MRDKGLDKGLIREFDDSKRDKRGYSKGFFGFRKMFRDYLTKLNVAFFDACCPELTGNEYPVRFDGDNGLEYFDGVNGVWTVIPGLGVVEPLTLNQTLTITRLDGAGVASSPLVIVDANPTYNRTNAVAVPATITLNASNMVGGLLTTTSAAATNITLPSAANLASTLQADQGSHYDFVVDNTAGANTVTITPGGSTTASSALTGGNDMTLAAGEIAMFRILWFSANDAIIARLM